MELPVIQGQIIQEPKMQEFSSLFMTHRLNVMHAPAKFHEYIPYRLGVMARTRSGTYGQMDGRTDLHTDRRRMDSRQAIRYIP